MEEMKGFGESSQISGNSSPTIEERLKIERMKAFKTLEKSSTLGKSRKSIANNQTDYVPYRRLDSINITDLITDKTIDLQSTGISNKISFEQSGGPSTISRKRIAGNRTAPTNDQTGTPGLNRTDYVPYRRLDSINITDLIVDKTIDLQSSTLLSSDSNKISFEPSEITGRSTMCKTDDGQQKKHRNNMIKIPTVEEILTQSCSKDVRNLYEYLQDSNTTNSFDTPRTADLSLSEIHSTKNSNSKDIVPNFSTYQQNDGNSFNDSHFMPGELMKSKFISDEISWEQEYATIPRQKQNKKLLDSDSYTFSAPNSDFSIGDFFNKRSENLLEMISSMSPKKHQPQALIDSSFEFSNSTRFSIPERDNTGKLSTNNHDKTFRKSNLLSSMANQKEDEQKDNSYILSISAITNALNEIDSDQSANILINKLLQGKKSKNRVQSSTEPLTDITKKQNQFLQKDRNSQEGFQERNIQNSQPINKENIKPNPNQLSDTISVTDSILDCSELQKFEDEKILNESLEKNKLSERRLLMETKSPDYGKYSLPNYGIITRTNSAMSSKRNEDCDSSTTGAINKFRSNSQCSSSSEFSHNGNKLPLKATATEITWGSIKLRTSVRKSIQIKNTSHKRLIIRAEISGPGFQIINNESGNLLTLQSQECRTIMINFCPTVIGAAIGKLTFHPPNLEQSSVQQIIYLNGYGGHASLNLQGILKGPIGSPFLPIGELRQLSRPLETYFTLYNKGPLTAFACIKIDSIGLDISHLSDCIEINPMKTLIKPETHIKVRVIFKPRRDDIKRILKKISNVITLANITIICGDDPTRQRIRNIVKEMNSTQKSTIQSTTLSKLWKKFPDEINLNELSQFKENSTVGVELVSTLKTHEIALTLNHTELDQTTLDTITFDDVDETIMFRTIISQSSFTDNSNQNQQNNDDLKNASSSTTSISESWSVRPNQLCINPFHEKNAKISIMIKSNFFTKQYFDIDTNYRHLFEFQPKSGHIFPGEEIEILIKCKPTGLPCDSINIMVYLENERIIIPVKIKRDNLPVNFR